MMYGLWRVAGREQKGACGIPPARWVWSEDLKLFKFLFTKAWLGGGVVWFSGKWSVRSAGDLLQGLPGQLCEGRKIATLTRQIVAALLTCGFWWDL